MQINKLPSAPNVDTSVTKPTWDWLIKMGKLLNQLVDWVNSYTAPTTVIAHASTHASGASDPITPASIGAMTLSQFTGTFSANGYRKLPDGTMIQWLTANATGDNYSFSWPTAFSTACYGALSTSVASGNYVTAAYNLSVNGGVLTSRVSTTGSGTAGTYFVVGIGK